MNLFFCMGPPLPNDKCHLPATRKG
jgi:hypothetical protein